MTLLAELDTYRRRPKQGSAHDACVRAPGVAYRTKGAKFLWSGIPLVLMLLRGRPSSFFGAAAAGPFVAASGAVEGRGGMAMCFAAGVNRWLATVRSNKLWSWLDSYRNATECNATWPSFVCHSLHA